MPIRILVFLAWLVLMNLQACTVNTTRDVPERNRLEPFDRLADYQYNLQSLERASSYAVDLNAERFIWPALGTEADTAFLEIRIQACLLYTSPSPRDS